MRQMPVPAELPRLEVRSPRPRTQPAPRKAGCAVALVAVALVAALGVAVFVWSQTGPAAPGVVTDAVGLTFMETVGFHAVNGDAIEDVAVLARDASDQILLVVFDGASMREIWRAGPFGSYGQAFQYTKAAVVGNRVLVTDFRAQAHLYDLASGTPVATVPLPDRAKDVCRAAGATQVELRLQNERRILLEGATGASAPAVIDLGANSCVPVADLSIAEVVDFLPPAAAPQGLGPERSGERVHVLVGDGVRIAVGRRAAGIRVPMAAGLGPDGMSAVWSAVIPTVDEAQVQENGTNLLFRLGAGRLYVAYGLNGDKGARLAALDARTGARLWETSFTDWSDDPDLNVMHIGPNRILIEEFLEAAVFDASTGALLARIASR